MPASASTSASPSFATVTEVAPAASCSRATCGDLCVFACGRSVFPFRAASSAIFLMLRSSTAASTARTGVSTSKNALIGFLLSAHGPAGPQSRHLTAADDGLPVDEQPVEARSGPGRLGVRGVIPEVRGVETGDVGPCTGPPKPAVPPPARASVKVLPQVNGLHDW